MDKESKKRLKEIKSVYKRMVDFMDELIEIKKQNAENTDSPPYNFGEKPYTREECETYLKQMNENLNLVKKLKNVPAGTKFYCTVIGDCDYEGYSERWGLLSFRNNNGNSIEVGGNGNSCVQGECIIFPSKDQRNWDKFEYDPIKIGTPVMVRDNKLEGWLLKYYSGDGECHQQIDKEISFKWKYIIPVSDFDFENLCRKGEAK